MPARYISAISFDDARLPQIPVGPAADAFGQSGVVKVRRHPRHSSCNRALEPISLKRGIQGPRGRSAPARSRRSAARWPQDDLTTPSKAGTGGRGGGKQALACCRARFRHWCRHRRSARSRPCECGPSLKITRGRNQHRHGRRCTAGHRRAPPGCVSLIESSISAAGKLIACSVASANGAPPSSVGSMPSKQVMHNRIADKGGEPGCRRGSTSSRPGNEFRRS